MKINDLILGISGFLVVTFILSLINIKSKNSSWKGTLVDKYKDSDDESGIDYFKLVFKTDEGKRKVMRVDEKSFNESQIGTRYEKKKGEYLAFPEKTI